MRPLTTALTFLFLALGTITFAQPGSLDGTFGVDGIVTTDFGATEDQGSSVAIQSDGKIVVAGYTNDWGDKDLAVIRYNTDGTFDNNFGTNGVVTTDFNSGSFPAYGKSVIIQPDGKIVVAGQYNLEFALARYNTDGTLDTSFSGDGKVVNYFGNSTFARSAAIQSDGKIVVAGKSEGDFIVVRYNTDGTLDSGFGTGGKVTTDFGLGFPDDGYSVAIQPDGKIVMAGIALDGGSKFALARYNADGTLDNSFGVDGKVTTDFGTVDGASGRSVAIQPDGKIVVAGSSHNVNYSDFALARYNTDGMLDNSFGVNGKVTTTLGTNNDWGRSVAIQSDGKIIVAGSSSDSTNYADFSLARYNGDGTLDNSFGVGGKVVTAIEPEPNTDFGLSVAIQPDGNIVLAGYSWSFTDTDFAVVRYISGLNIGIIDLSLAHSAPLIYPNPIDERATLEYTLQKDETISILLLDMQGKTLRTFMKGKKQVAGEHQLSIDLSETLPSGNYLIVISSPNGRATVQVTK